MRMSRWLMAVVLVCSTPLVFADDTDAKRARPDSKQKVISVGNEKAAGGGVNDESKTVREAETHTGKPSDKREHDINVGNEQAAGHGSNADTKSVKPEKTDAANKGKHQGEHKATKKTKRHDKKMKQKADKKQTTD